MKTILLLFTVSLTLCLQSLTQAQSLQNDDQNRSNRLSEISEKLGQKGSDGVALLTEAVRLCGFSIWNDDRAKISDPLTTPGLGLGISESDIKGYVDLFRRGDRMAVADMIAALDPSYRAVGGKKGLENYVNQLFQRNLFSPKPSSRALAFFLQALGKTHNEQTDAPMTLSSKLDAVQSLLAMRVLGEEMAVPLRKQIRKSASEEIFASLETNALQDEAPGWAEDAFAGGVTGLFGEVVDGIGELGGKVTGAVGRVNAIAAISKFILTYKFLKGKVTLEGKGQPLIRTKDFDAGDERTTVARFYIDGTGVTDWLKDNRKYFHTLGMDLDTPKSGPLKNVETFWDIRQDHKYATKQLIQAVRGTTDLSRLKTDENGEAKVTWEGKPQPKKIDPKKAMPIVKSVWMHIAPQVKSVEMQQDIVDAVTGAIGLKDGPSGAITPIMEILYRMKWHAPAHFELQVRDWVEGETLGILTVEAKGQGHTYTPDSSVQMSIDHTLSITDYVMGVVGGEAYPQLDPAMLKKLPPDVAKQVEAGMKEAKEAAKKRSFLGQGPGMATISINDSAFSQYVVRDCAVETVRSEEAWKANLSKEMAQYISEPATFSVEANLEAKTAIVSFTGKAEGIHTRVAGKSNTKNPERMDMFSNITIDSELFANGKINLPLKETPLQGQNGSNYYGTATLKFKFGPKREFTGSMIISYSVTRKMPPPVKKAG